MKEQFSGGVISFIVGSFFTFIIICSKKIYQIISQKYKIFKLDKLKFIFDENLNIYTIENAVPEYYDINIATSEIKLFIDFPEEYKGTVSSIHKFHSDISFDGSNSYRDLSIQTGIYDLENLINEHRKKIAKDFLEGKNGCKFNEIKYGVLNIDIGTRIGDRELPCAYITTYETDFFTYRVLNSIYRELISRNHEISQVSSLETLLKYNCFMCSIGVNAIVLINSKSYNREEIIFTKRSMNTINYQNMYHISVNEGMCYMEYNPSNGKLSVEECLLRGIDEELGVSRDFHLKNKSEYIFMDLFISRDTFDFSISSLIKLNNIYFEQIQSLIAKDRKFELDKIEAVLVDKQNIKEYVAQRKFVPQGLYTLNSFYIRRFGHAIEVPRKRVL